MFSLQLVGADVGKVGLGKALSAGWISMDRSKKPPTVTRKVSTVHDAVKEHLCDLAAAPKARLEEYKKRKLVQEVTLKVYSLGRGKGFKTKVEKARAELTPEMIASGEWRTADFKPYNFDAMGISPPAGHLHPLLKVCLPCSTL